MSRLSQVLISLALLGLSAAPALAASSASSASSDGASTSVGSSSTSIEKSSDSSSKTTKVAEGDYRVVAVADATAQPGKLRVTLQPVGASNASSDGEFYLYLPPQAAQQGRIVAGAVVTAKQREYGLEFAAGAPRQAFFLVLNDEWVQELQTRVVKI